MPKIIDEPYLIRFMDLYKRFNGKWVLPDCDGLPWEDRREWAGRVVAVCETESDCARLEGELQVKLPMALCGDWDGHRGSWVGL